MATSTIRDEPLGPYWVHVCVDMQELFAPGTEWGLEWMPRVLPNIVALCARDPAHTLFTRFIPARRPGDGEGSWKRYYTRWASMTIEQIGPAKIELVSALQIFVPPAEILDKPVYSPWLGSALQTKLQARRCDTVIITGGETDMCVLTTILGAIDYGYRTILVRDAVCSASDKSHDDLLELFSSRYGQQVEAATTSEVIDRLVR
jgi:nicotinamidase-related amidase